MLPENWNCLLWHQKKRSPVPNGATINSVHCLLVWTSSSAKNYEAEKEKRVALVTREMELLKNLDPAGTDSLRLRVIEKDKIWVIRDGNGITFMKPEDY